MLSFQQYLKNNRIKQVAMAERLGVSQGTISKLTLNEISPTVDLAVKIENETGGDVKVESWPEFSKLLDRRPQNKSREPTKNEQGAPS